MEGGCVTVLLKCAAGLWTTCWARLQVQPPQRTKVRAEGTLTSSSREDQGQSRRNTHLLLQACERAGWSAGAHCIVGALDPE